MTDIRTAAAEHVQGLTTEPQRHLNSLLRDYDPYLSLRRIPEGDPAFKPGVAEFGVWEETSAATTKWVFTLGEIQVTNPAAVLARVAMGDASKLSVAERMEYLRKSQDAVKLAEQKRFYDEARARAEEAAWIGTTSKNYIRHRLDGEDVMIGDETRSVRSHII